MEKPDLNRKMNTHLYILKITLDCVLCFVFLNQSNVNSSLGSHFSTTIGNTCNLTHDQNRNTGKKHIKSQFYTLYV